MPEIEYQEFVAVEKVGHVVVAFSNRPFCEFAFTSDEGDYWVSGCISKDENEIVTSSSQVCSDEQGFIYLGTSKGNIYRANIAYDNLGWSMVNDVSFADDDSILYVKIMGDGSVFVASGKGVCIFSLDRGMTWKSIRPNKGLEALEWCGREPGLLCLGCDEVHLDWRRISENEIKCARCGGRRKNC